MLRALAKAGSQFVAKSHLHACTTPGSFSLSFLSLCSPTNRQVLQRLLAMDRSPPSNPPTLSPPTLPSRSTARQRPEESEITVATDDGSSCLHASPRTPLHHQPSAYDKPFLTPFHRHKRDPGPTGHSATRVRCGFRIGYERNAKQRHTILTAHRTRRDRDPTHCGTATGDSPGSCRPRGP